VEAPEIAAAQSRGLTKKTIQTGGGQYHNQEVHDHGGKTLATVALVIGSVALGAVLVAVPLVLLLMDARAGTVGANMRASVQEQIADARSTAREARTTAKVTEDKLSELRDKLNAKGMNIPPLNGHD
jgi:hypothetical protein